jgi:NAD(P)-dependent dehydrogenase (short-subunit alcohol dehydrogenase family)
MATALVTGANRGIGLELTRQLLERGDTVVAACRAPSPELSATRATVVTGIDVSDAESVGRLALQLDRTAVDLLVNNAGILRRGTLDNLDFDRIRRQLEVNALGPLRLTAALLPNLPHGAKVAFVTSRMGSIGDNSSGGSYGYRMSKAALNMAAVSLAHDLADRGIAVAILHPGFVRTEMTGGQGNVGPEEAAAGLLARIDALTLETSGSFWHANGERLPW